MSEELIKKFSDRKEFAQSQLEEAEEIEDTESAAHWDGYITGLNWALDKILNAKQ